jgi:hypothetical protein
MQAEAPASGDENIAIMERSLPTQQNLGSLAKSLGH